MEQNSNAKQVENLLKELKVYYEKEKSYEDLKYRGKLRFDFYLPLYNLCIEFHGVQHYEYVEHFHGTENKFQEQQLKDDIKRKYCKNNNINLIELPCNMTISEIRVKLIKSINELSDQKLEILPEINEFLRLNESHKVYINKLHDEYEKMLKQLKISQSVDYSIFYDYVIEYWGLTNKKIIQDKNNNYLECWINTKINNDEIKEYNNDTVLQHYQKLHSLGLFKFSHIPSSVVYEHYKCWIEIINPSAKIMKQSEYTKKLGKLLEDLNYTKHEKKRLRQLTKDQFDINIFDNLYVDETIQSKVFINPDLDIKSKIDDIEKDLKILDKIQFKNKYNENLIRSYLNYIKNNDGTSYLTMIAPYQVNEIKDLDIDIIIEKLINYHQDSKV